MMKHLLVALLAGALCFTPGMASAHTGHDHGPKKSSNKAKKKPKQTQRIVIYAVPVEGPVRPVSPDATAEKIRKPT